MEATAPKLSEKERINLSHRISASLKKSKDRTRAKLHGVIDQHKSTDVANFQTQAPSKRYGSSAPADFR
jgi:hypothetical protein